MISKAFLLLPLFAISGAFACAASGKCMPDVYAKRFTLVTGNADAALVQEYALAGCHEIRVDSIVRRSVSADSLRVAKGWADGTANPSPAATIYASYSSPKLDSAQGVACAKVRTVRRIDSIPRASFYKTPEGTDLSVETVVPVDSDSVYVCLNGSCSKIVPRVVHNVLDTPICLDGMPAPLPTPEAALDYLKERIKAGSSLSRLRRIRLAYFNITCPIVVYDYAARAASMLPVTVKETRLSYASWNVLVFPPLRDWTDTTISKRLALPSSANAGDFYAPETLLFDRTSPFGVAEKDKMFYYPTGVELYSYRGNTLPQYNCTDAMISPSPVVSTIGDSLRLEGLSLSLSTSAECAARGIDAYADKVDDWLFAPSSEATFQKDFFHGSSAENGYSWPVVDDSVHVRGQKIPLATLTAFLSTLPRPQARSTFTVRAVDHLLFVTLSEAADVRVLSADGRILSHRDLPAGTSSMELPNAHRGILFVNAGKSTFRVPAP